MAEVLRTRVELFKNPRGRWDGGCILESLSGGLEKELAGIRGANKLAPSLRAALGLSLCVLWEGVGSCILCKDFWGEVPSLDRVECKISKNGSCL